MASERLPHHFYTIALSALSENDGKVRSHLNDAILEPKFKPTYIHMQLILIEYKDFFSQLNNINLFVIFQINVCAKSAIKSRL